MPVDASAAGYGEAWVYRVKQRGAGTVPNTSEWKHARMRGLAALELIEKIL